MTENDIEAEGDASDSADDTGATIDRVRADIDVVLAETEAMKTVYGALRPLEKQTQQTIIEWVTRRLALEPSGAAPKKKSSAKDLDGEGFEVPVVEVDGDTEDDIVPLEGDALEGISPVGIKWVRRNKISSKELSELFSLGLDDIDFVAKKVPGETNKDRLKNVLLVKAMAGYLGNGAPRVTHEDLKTAAEQYDAYDGKNFATYMKSFSREVHGSKSTGYVLTAAGLTEARVLIEGMIAAAKATDEA